MKAKWFLLPALIVAFAFLATGVACDDDDDDDDDDNDDDGC